MVFQWCFRNFRPKTKTHHLLFGRPPSPTCILLIKLVSQDGWILAKFSFCVFMVHKSARKERGQYPAILTWRLVNKGFIICHKKALIEWSSYLFTFEHWRGSRLFAKVMARFLVASRLINHRKSFYFHGKYFAKENFRAPAATSAKCCCGNKTGNTLRSVSL